MNGMNRKYLSLVHRIIAGTALCSAHGAQGTAIHTLQVPEVLEIQKAYVRKVVETVNDLDNVLYEICNEGLRHTRDWQYEMVRFVKSVEAKMPKQHPVGMTSVGDMNDDCLKSPADWTSLATTGWDQPRDPWTSDPPAADGRGRTWTPHKLGTGIDFHSLAVADFDQDGDEDVFACDAEVSEGPWKWVIWENTDSRARQFTPHVILDARLGGHEVRIGDVDGDGDLDMVSKPWQPSRQSAIGGKIHVDFLENLLHRGAHQPDLHAHPKRQEAP